MNYECPRCNFTFDAEPWDNGWCPKCELGFYWDECCNEDYSDCSAYIVWENYP